jgi:hypothetical protein
VLLYVVDTSAATDLTAYVVGSASATVLSYTATVVSVATDVAVITDAAS